MDLTTLEGGNVMRSLMKIGLFPLLLFTSSLILAPQASAADSDAKGLFEKRCSMCHPTDRPLSKNKSGEEWRQTVMRMKAHAGDRISAEEAEIIIQYLTGIRGT